MEFDDYEKSSTTYFNNITGGILTLFTRRTHEVQESVCADPQNKVAAETCCDIGDANLNGKRYCRVHAERVTFDHAADRCAANEAEICHPKRMNKGTENCNEDFQSSVRSSCSQGQKEIMSIFITSFMLKYIYSLTVITAVYRS